MESWLSSAAPKRGRIMTPGVKSSTSLRFDARDSPICRSPITAVPPGTRLSSSRASCSVRDRSAGTRTPSTTTGGMVGGGGVWARAGAAHRRAATIVVTRIGLPFT